MRLILCWLILFSVAIASQPLERSYASGSEEMDAAKLLGLVPPVEVVYSGYYLDGGTIAFRLVSEGKPALEGCLDGRLFHPSPRSIYLGALPSNWPGARRLELGSKEDRAVTLLIRAWLKRKFSPQELKKMRDPALKWHLDSPGQPEAARILSWLELREARFALYRDEAACARVLGLQAPVELTKIAVLDRSAATIGFILRDHRNKQLKGRFQRDESTDGIWIDGLAPPESIGGLASGSEKETAILGLLSHCLADTARSASRKPVGISAERAQRDLLSRRLRTYMGW